MGRIVGEMWHYQKDGTAVGPLSEGEIVNLINSGAISRQTLVWMKGTPEWVMAEDTALGAHFRSGPPPFSPLPGAVPPPMPIPPPPLSGPPAGFRDLRPLANWVTAMLALGLLIGVVALWASIGQMELLNRITHGEHFTVEEANASDSRIQLIGLGQLVILITTVIFFGRWIYVAACNVRALGAQNLTCSPGWAVGYYFIPFANLFKPFGAMKEIWKASGNPAAWEQEPGSPILGTWWTFWIFSCVFGQIALRTTLGARTPDDYSAAAAITMVSDVIDILLAIVAIWLVRSLTQRQLETAQRRG